MHKAVCTHLILLMLLIGGCTPGPVRGPVPRDTIEQQAEAMIAAGNYQLAGEYYLKAAEQARDVERQAFLLIAADSFIQASDPGHARLILDELAGQPLKGSLAHYYSICQAGLALADNRPAQVITLLDQVSVPASDKWFARVHRLRSEALFRQGDYLNSARERILIDSPSMHSDQRLSDHYAIWEALSKLTDGALQQHRKSPPDPLSGWLELVELTRLYMQQPDALREVTPHWQMRYPAHPASTGFINELLGSMQAAGQPPAQVALLLPLSGSLAGPANAIRDGILAAYFETPESSHPPRIRIYDSSGDPDTIMTTYQQAVAEGAMFIIGPLRKETIAVLAQAGSLPVPVLALNQLDAIAAYSHSLYQFGLSPEDEAREVARRAWRDSHTRALAFMPQGNWGERVFAAFNDEWQKLGGTLLDMAYYNPDAPDHGKQISSLLNLDLSKARHLKLVRLLGQRLEFEPRRRMDVDFIFLLARPGQARLIRPQFSFHHASRIPIYATSHIYTGSPDPTRDTDLNGILFCDTPWTLDDGGSWQHIKQSINTQWPENAKHYSRLYAMGIDAWQIIPYLDQLGSGLFNEYLGVTGNLSLDNAQQLHRELRWARFKHGLPQVEQPDTTEVEKQTNRTPGN